MRFENVSGVYLACLVACICAGCCCQQAQAKDVGPKVIRDLMWVWGGTPKRVVIDPPERTLANFVQATTIQRMKLLGVPNVIGCGYGLPTDDKTAWAITREWQNSADRLTWEIQTDDGLHKPPFSYARTAARVRRLVRDYPKVKAVLLDDMTSQSVKAGFRAEHVQALVKALAAEKQDIKTWGVVYTMNMRQKEKGVHEIIKALDVINVWIWHSNRDIPKLEPDIEYLEKHFPGKPIVLGLYLYNYGGGRGPIPPKLLEQQCEVALKLAHEKRIIGMVFLTINNDPEALQWTADWIKKVGNQEIGSPE